MCYKDSCLTFLYWKICFCILLEMNIEIASEKLPARLTNCKRKALTRITSFILLFAE